MVVDSSIFSRCCFAGAPVYADKLELLDGQILDGKFIGREDGIPGEIVIQAAAGSSNSPRQCLSHR